MHQVAQIGVEGSDPGYALSGDAAPKLVGISGSFVVTVTYHPLQRGTANGTVDITTTDAALESVKVKLVGQAQAAASEVCAETKTVGTFECATAENPVLTIDYGSLLLNSPVVGRVVRITSKGDAPLSYQGATLLDGTPLAFTLDPDQNAGRELAPSEQHTFSVLFNPAVDAAFTGALQVTTNDPAMPLVTVQLKALAATSLSCKLVVSPANITFGSVPTGSSQDGSVIINNTGTQPCTISNIALAGSSAFTFNGVPTSGTLAPKTSQTATIHYAPNSNQNDTGTFTVTSDDPVTPSAVVTLSGSGVEPPDCVLVPTPTKINFGSVELGDRVIGSVLLNAVSKDGVTPCTLLSAGLATANSNFVMSKVTLGIVSKAGGPFGGGTPVGLTYAPTIARDDTTTLVIRYQGGLFGGPTLTLNIPVSAKSGTKRLCIHPARLHFGAVGVGSSKSLSFTLTACGGSAVSVQSLRVVGASSPFALNPAPTLPNGLTAGASMTQTVVASPTTAANVADEIEVLSDDPAFPKQRLPIDMGPETVSADAGEVMYTWQAAPVTTQQEGTVMSTNLQGPPNRSPFYGTKAGESCAGCHTVTSDGKFVALLEYGTSPTMRIVDARTKGAIPLPNIAGGLYPSWNPNTKTNPPYQFVYNEGKVLKVASAVTGVIGELPGANDPKYISSQPSWGPDGKIVFVRGDGNADAGDFGITGPTDLMVIPESGGTAVAVMGASGTSGQNYLPEFSPNGKYIAYTYSAQGQSTRSAPDSEVRLVEVATGSILTLPQLNAAGPNSWPTWSKDGLLLSFSSTRSGGKGSADIYYAPVDQNSGVDGPAVNMSNVNTSDYDHISRWAFLPPP